MELKRYLLVVWRWLWMIVLAAVLAAGFSYLATTRQPKIYQASTRLLVGQSFRSTNPSPADFQTSTALALTYIEIAKTTPVLQATIEALGLKMSAEDLRGRFRASLVPNTQLVELRVDDTDPLRAQALANELAYQLTLQGPAAQQDPRQREFVQQQIDDLQTKITEAQKSIAELRNSIDVNVGARDVSAKQQQIASLEAEIARWQQSYVSMQQLLAPRSPNYLSVIEPAQVPRYPYAPNVLLNVALAAAIGLMLSLGVVVLIEYLDDTLKHVDEVAHLLELPILGTLAQIGNSELDWSARLKMLLPRWTRSNPNVPLPPESIEGTQPIDSSQGRLITMYASRSPEAEAYRELRTNLQFNNVDKPIRSIVVTSAGKGEGKSLTAANLAVVMAQSGLRTILIDADLRRPTQHRLFNFVNSTGLTDSLLSTTSPTIYLQASPVENLRILLTGPLPPNPSEMLASNRMRQVKQQFEAEADLLIFDSPPCLPVTDAAILATLTDGVLMVVDVTRTTRKEALRAKEILTKVGARILGVATNRVALRQEYNYYYTYAVNDQKQRKHKSKTEAQLTPRLIQGK